MVSFESGLLFLDVLESETPDAEFWCVYRRPDSSSGLVGNGRKRDAGDSYTKSDSYGVGVESVVVSLISRRKRLTHGSDMVRDCGDVREEG
jgi:hypothetical protein